MKKILLLLPILTSVWACNKTVNDLEITSPTELTFTKQGGTQSITMNAFSDWTAKCDAGWVTLSPATGTADADGVSATIKVTISENPEYDERSGTVSITSNNKVFTVHITQETRTAIILDDEEQTVSYEAQILTVRGRSNVSKTVAIESSCANWISYTPSKALESFDIMLNIAENTKEKERKGYVYIKGNEFRIGDTLLIIQKKKPAILSCDTPGLYSKKTMLAGYTDYVSQTGFFHRTGGLNEFQIANVATRKYCIFSGLQPLTDENSESYTVNIKQNMSPHVDSELSLSLTVQKKENGYIWADEAQSGLGVITKIE